MALRHRGGARDGGPPRDSLGDAAGEVRQTLLLDQLFERLDEEAALTVLDVGSGVAETVTFFSAYRSRLYFADLLDAPALQTLPDEDPEAHYREVFAELLTFPPDTRFDICLFWDFFNHLPLPALKCFGRALAPYVNRGTVGHGFAAFKATAPALARDVPEQAVCYGVRGRDELIVRPRPGGPVPQHAHSRTVLADALVCFEIVRGTLLQGGAMELFLRGTGRG